MENYAHTTMKRNAEQGTCSRNDSEQYRKLQHGMQ